jgi:hypothetical protein
MAQVPNEQTLWKAAEMYVPRKPVRLNQDLSDVELAIPTTSHFGTNPVPALMILTPVYVAPETSHVFIGDRHLA